MTVIPLSTKRRHPGLQSEVAAKNRTMNPKTTRLPSSRQPSETILEWLQRLTQRYSRSRVPSLRREAQRWRRILKAHRCPGVSA